jgi:CarboxypepD_reg-like domain
MRNAALTVALITLVAFSVRGQASERTWFVKGCLVDRTNDEPLMFAKVCVQGSSDTTVTDAQGFFSLSLHADPVQGRRYLLVEYLGFERYLTRIKSKDLERVRVHRVKRKKFAPDVA